MVEVVVVKYVRGKIGSGTGTGTRAWLLAGKWEGGAGPGVVLVTSLHCLSGQVSTVVVGTG